MKLSPEDVQEYRFTVVRGAKPGQQITFEGGVRDVKIGRAVDNDIVISDPTVSRLHARVELRPDGWFLIDAGSASGVEKMGFRISAREPLESGDEFKLGDTILRFEVVAKKGDSVMLKLSNRHADEHGYEIAAFGIKEVVEGSKTKDVKFMADKAGVFPIKCHLHPAHVVGQLVVLE